MKMIFRKFSLFKKIFFATLTLLFFFIIQKNHSENKFKIANGFIKKSSLEIKNYSKVLLILNPSVNLYLRANLDRIFYATRIKFEKVTELDLETIDDYCVIIFESYNDYLKFKRKLKDFKQGVIVFNTPNAEQTEYFNVKECQFNYLENFFNITKFKNKRFKITSGVKINNFKFKQLFYNKQKYNSHPLLLCENEEPIIFVNKLKYSKRVFISLDNLNGFGILKLLLLDSIRYASNKKIDVGLKRFIQIDIENAFNHISIRKNGYPMVPEDFYELIKLQEDLSDKYFNHNGYKFKFNIGYSGGFFRSGIPLEDEVDNLFAGKNLIKNYSLLVLVFSFYS